MSYEPGPLPSAEAIVDGLPWLNKTRASRTMTPLDIAIKARIIMREAKSSSDALAQLDALLDTCGVEEIAQFPGAADPGVRVRYLNAGETYAPTILRFRGKFRVESYGDLVEALERRGIRFRRLKRPAPPRSCS
jgi:hypothetical protein